MFETLNDDLETLKNTININANTKDVKPFFWLYPFTNENLKGYYSFIDFKEKDVLCVTASGDHALNAILKGAKNVECFDVNPLAKYYSELKIAAIKTLNLEEFLLFFYNKKLFDRNKFYFNKNIYNKISNFLEKEIKDFWDYLFTNYTSKEVYRSKLFTSDYLKKNALCEANSYLTNDGYYSLRNILNDKKIIYHDMNFKELNSLNKDFDIIMLSNIPAFLNRIYDKDVLLNFKNLIESLKTKNNIIVLNYFYYNNLINDDIFDNLEIYNKLKVKDIFTSDKYEYKSFESSDCLSRCDETRKKLKFKKDQILITKKH